MTETKPYKLLVFDWDGTLMDSAGEIVFCFQSATRDLGLRPPSEDEIHNIVGLGMHEALKNLFPEISEEADRQRIVERYRHYYFHPEKIQPELFAGVEAMLHELQAQDYFLAVATGKGRRGLDEVLTRTGLDQVFHLSRCVDEAHSKPHPQMLEDIMDYLGADRDETLMIGDTEYDLMMARNAGADAVGVCCGTHSRERLLQHTPRTCLEHTHQLSSWLESK